MKCHGAVIERKQHRMDCKGGLILVNSNKIPVVKTSMIVYVSHSGVSEQLLYLKSLGVGAVILEGLFRHDISPTNLTEIDQSLGTLPQFTRLITESRKAGMYIFIIEKYTWFYFGSFAGIHPFIKVKSFL